MRIKWVNSWKVLAWRTPGDICSRLGAQSCLTLCDRPSGLQPAGLLAVHGISQATGHIQACYDKCLLILVGSFYSMSLFIVIFFFSITSMHWTSLGFKFPLNSIVSKDFGHG